MEQFLYRLQLVRPAMLTEGPSLEEGEVLAAHEAYLADMTDRGVVLGAGRTLTTGPETFGLVILRADGEETARGIMRNDPAVEQGLMTAALYPFRIAFWRKP